jgi:hypothetical protein
VAASGSALSALQAEMNALVQQVREPALHTAAQASVVAMTQAQAWLRQTLDRDGATAEAHARRIALRIARSLALALLARHGQWALERGDRRPLLAALRFHAHGLGSIAAEPGAGVLGMDEPAQDV